MLCGGLCAFWIAAALVIRAGGKASPSLAGGLLHDFGRGKEGIGPSVSVVMPAHNEEELIDESLASIRSSDYVNVIEIIVVADRCTDGTVAIVLRHQGEDGRVRLIELDECPTGWSGKCHSCWNGYRSATGDYLLFTDADTLFDTKLVRASVGCMLKGGLDFLSLLGRLRFEHDFERSAQPIAAMTLMRMYPIAKANRDDAKKRRPFANGQFMLFSREAYEAVGTHERLKGAILEDLRFARRLTNHGFKLGVALAGDMFTVRMYDTVARFHRGWKRIFIEGANRNIPRLRIAGARLRGLSIWPIVSAAGIVFGFGVLRSDFALGIVTAGLGFVSFALGFFVLRRIYDLQGAPARCLLWFWSGCLQVAALLSEAARDLRDDRGIEWAALHYEVESREEGKG